MKVISQYIADDGTIFKSELECRKYEDKLEFERHSGDILLLDSEGRKIEDPTSSAQNIFYMYIRTDEAADYLSDLIGGRIWMPWDRNDDCVGPHAGVWVWNCYGDDWMPLERVREMFDDLKSHAPDWEELGL